MRKLVTELRRREVFRTAGLYVGIAWILIEGASVLLPAFDAPAWVLRALIVTAIAGLPVAVVLAWIYDVTDKGIDVQADATDTVVIPFGGRRMDFVVIGVLSIALAFSIYLNITGYRTVTAEEPEPLSVLVADFENRTGDDLFDGSLEQALLIGMESAPFIAGYRRDAAMDVAASMQATGNALDEATARLVAVREGIKLVMSGSIDDEGQQYALVVRAIDPKNGDVLATADAEARDKLAVLAAVGEIAGELRAELGDDSLDRGRLVASETFTAANLEAARAYATAQSLQYEGKYDEAMAYYEQALVHDPGFGRAYSGLALSAYSLGRTDTAEQLWEQALATLDTMTERERLRTLGLYYSVVTRNFGKAIETYETLVEKYPADDTAHNGLAVQYFYSLDFQRALAQGQELLDIYPRSVMGRSNYALYAMYASDFDTAVAEARTVQELDATYFKAWLPVAMNAVAGGDLDAARAAYDSMAAASPRGVLTAGIGLADVALFAGDVDAARSALQTTIAAADSAGSQYFLASAHVVLAEAYVDAGETGLAHDALEAGLGVSAGLSRQVPAALMYAATGRAAEAEAIAATLRGQLQAQSRAYARLIEGRLVLESGDAVAAIEAITAGIELADLWLLRFHLGRAYFEAGYFAEALDEFTACRDRHGEATAIFLDDVPTYRYTATLPYWQGRAQEQLGMRAAAESNYRAFIDRRGAGDVLADDARRRLP